MSAVDRIADALLFDMLSESPDIAAHLGIKEVAGRTLPSDTLTDFSDAGAARRSALMTRAAGALAKIDATALAGGERMTYDVVRYLVEDGMFWIFRGRKGQAFPEIAYPLNPVEGGQQVLATLLLDDHVLSAPADAETYRARLERLPGAVAQLIDAARGRLREGFKPARRFLERSHAGAEAMMRPAPDHPLIARLRRMDGCPPALVRDAEACLRERILPAYDDLAREIEAQAALDAPAVGLWNSPNGDEHYAFLLRAHTTTGLSPAEVHEIGLAEVAELTARIRARFAEIGIRDGALSDMYGGLQARPDGRFPASAEGRAALRREAERIVSDLERDCAGLFERMPRAGCVVAPVSEALEASVGSHYTPPAADGTRPGVFTINLKDALERPRWELPVLCRHEIMPGHHLQLAIAQELTDLPAFRRAIVFNAYIEGWAKYAEALPEDAGFADDPRVALCRMRGELYSTVNLVLDTGLNAMRWPYEKAVAYFKDAAGASQALAELVVARSIFQPGQLCSYKIGMRKMFDLKAKLALARGAAFRIKDFHSLVLDEGALPLSLLERRIDDAIRTTRA